jgi:hypothetical protein
MRRFLALSGLALSGLENFGTSATRLCEGLIFFLAQKKYKLGKAEIIFESKRHRCFGTGFAFSPPRVAILSLVY